MRYPESKTIENDINAWSFPASIVHMLLEAAESILGYFGFDRTVYGDRKKNRKWWSVEKRQRMREMFMMGKLKKM
jgi:hypothetical protein